MHLMRTLIILLLCAGSIPVSFADEKTEAKESTEKKESEKPKELKIPGVFEAAEAHEVQIKPESWSAFKVETAPQHGAQVKAGSPLVTFEARDLDRKIADSRRALDAAKLALALAEREFETARQLLPLDLKSAERTREIARQDLEYFETVTLPQSRKSAERSLSSAEYRLEYANEELKQLEQMYKADELTEQTEEIILIRARRDVDDAKYFLESTKLRTERALEVEIPRQREQLQMSTEKQLLEAEKSLRTLELALERKKHELDAQRLAVEKSEEEIGKLIADRELMELPAPKSGYAYYGQHARGKWTAVGTVEKQLRPGGAVTPNQVFLTIVNPETMFVRIDVSEGDLHKLEVGTKGHIVPTAFPDLKLEAEISELSLAPITPGTFDGKVTLKMNERPARVMPGMACSFVVAEVEKTEGGK